MPGLAYYVVEVANKEGLVTIAERAKAYGAPVKWLSSNDLPLRILMALSHGSEKDNKKQQILLFLMR